ncbi:hypothetical protein GC163_18460 [bacterium]|nr:hypothetical protein [bacterium]
MLGVLGRLFELGFFSLASRDDQKWIKELGTSLKSVILEETHRVLWLDPKHLSRSGPRFYSQEIQEFLHPFDRSLSDVSDFLCEEGWFVRLGAVTSSLLSSDELRAGLPDWEKQSLVLRRFACFISSLLLSRGKVERCYVADTGADSFLLIATPSMFEAIKDLPEDDIDANLLIDPMSDSMLPGN